MTREKGSGSVFYDKSRDRWKGTIEAGFTTKGARRRLTVIGKSQDDARTKLKAKQREVLLRGAPPEHVRASMTVKAWADRWLDQAQTRLSPSSFGATRSQMTHWVVPTIGRVRLDRLTPTDIRAVSKAILKAGLKESTANRAHRELLKMLRDAREDGCLVPDRVLQIRGPGAGDSDRTAIPVVDSSAILTIAASRADEARWLIAFLEALRPSEVLGLTWACINFEKKRIRIEWQLAALPYNVPYVRDSGFRVPDGYEAKHLKGQQHLVRPKTKSGWREIPLQESVERALIAWREKAPHSPYDLVFPDSSGGPRDDKADRAAFKELQLEAGVQFLEGREPRAYALYEARHSVATSLRQTGADDATIIGIMGHASILSTKPYLHTDDATTRDAMSAVEARLRTQASVEALDSRSLGSLDGAPATEF